MAVEAGKVVRPDNAAEGGLLDEDLVAMEPPNLEDISVIVRNKPNRTFLGGSRWSLRMKTAPEIVSGRKDSTGKSKTERQINSNK